MKRKPFIVTPYIQTRGIIFKGTITDFNWKERTDIGPSSIKELFIKVKFNHKDYPGIPFQGLYEQRIVGSELPFYVLFFSNLAYIAGIKEIPVSEVAPFLSDGSPDIDFNELLNVFNEAIFKGKQIYFKLKKMPEYKVKEDIAEYELDEDEEDEVKLALKSLDNIRPSTEKAPYPYPCFYHPQHGICSTIDNFVQTFTNEKEKEVVSMEIVDEAMEIVDEESVGRFEESL